MASYDTTIGPLLLGIFLNTYLYGLFTPQFMSYYLMKFNDSLATKSVVLFLFVLDTFYSISAMSMAWNYTVANFDNPSALEVIEWPYAFTPIGTALSASVTHVYLGFRIWRLNNSKIGYGVVVMLAIVSFGLGLCCSVEAWIIKRFPEPRPELPLFDIFILVWLTMQVIMGILVLFTHERTGFQKTDKLLDRFIHNAIQTGIFATIFSMGALFALAFAPSTNLYAIFIIPLGRIYTHVIMDTLLTRELLRDEMAGSCNMNTSSHPL